MDCNDDLHGISSSQKLHPWMLSEKVSLGCMNQESCRLRLMAYINLYRGGTI